MSPLKAITSPLATTARKMTPFENTSRSPRLANWRGRKPSWAMIDDSRGKSAYAVFAARMRIENVAIMVIQNRTPLPLYRYWAIRPNPFELSPSARYGLRWAATTEMPRKHVPRMAPIHMSVRAAFCDSGFLNAGTPLDTASTPERATAPDENARSSR